MTKLYKRMQAPALKKDYDQQLSSVSEELEHMQHALNKGDTLRVSNALLASGRMSEALARQTFIRNLSEWSHTLETIKTSDLKKFTTNFQYMLEREFEKQRLEAKLLDIQNMAEKGFVQRESIAMQLRMLADEVEAGGYPILLQRTPTEEEQREQAKIMIAELNERVSKLRP